MQGESVTCTSASKQSCAMYIHLSKTRLGLQPMPPGPCSRRLGSSCLATFFLSFVLFVCSDRVHQSQTHQDTSLCTSMPSLKMSSFMNRQSRLMQDALAFGTRGTILRHLCLYCPLAQPAMPFLTPVGTATLVQAVLHIRHCPVA